MLILGVSCFFHDASAALLKDGILMSAAEEERFTRKKHDYDFPVNAINFCLNKAKIKGADLDYVVFFEKPFVKFERILQTTFQTFPYSYKLFREAMIPWLTDKLWIRNVIQDKVGVNAKKILFCEHHLSHAASAFLCSPFEESAILTVDGVGEWSTATLGTGKNTEIKLDKEIRFPHSLGLLYSAFTAFLGFEVNEGEYKVMGMSSYGKPKYSDKIRELIKIADDGSFKLNMDYFSYHYSTEKTFSSKFEKLFGKPQNPDSTINQYYNDIAASIQKVTEDVLIKMANYLYETTGLKKLCIAGGVALNSAANGRILRETPFEEIFIQPSAGDGGGALGAALWAYYSLLGNKKNFVMEHAYWGEEYTNEYIEKFLKDNSIEFTKTENNEQLIDSTVENLVNGKVIGWFQGRFEWGPRALGNRSILADPRKPEMKDIVNMKIKFRESYRPFAPSVLAEEAANFFELKEIQKNYPARFMLFVVDVKNNKRNIIPAVTHVNGTARPQLVYEAANPLYYNLIKRFHKASGVPVILNTSFNLKGKPIVNTPENAFNTFSKSEMDILVLGNYVIKKRK